MADLNDFKNKNTKFTGTSGQRISTGATGTRVDEQARLRFNTSTNLMEYYTGTDWKSIDSPPTITFVSIDGGADTTSGQVDNEASGNVTIQIKGSLFDTTNGAVTFVGTSETLSPITTTRNSTNLFTVTIPYSSFDDASSPYTVKILNGSGLSAELIGGISADQSAPAFITSAGTLGTITDGTRSSYTLSSAAAIDADGDTITYSISAGSLPPGLSLNSSTAAITGTATAVVSNTTSTFTVSAATTASTSTRQFSITVNAPVVQSFTATGPATFSVPVGVSSVDVLVVAGGGSGGNQHGGGGGAGGLIFRPGMPVTPGGTVAVTVGGGGSPGSGGCNGSGPAARDGGDSTFGPLTAKGGAAGGSYISAGHQVARSGGSGGGGAAPGEGTNSPGGTGTQPSQPGDSGTYGFGNPGGTGLGNPQSSNWTGGGGGGAGGAGTPAPGGTGGTGGTGRTYTTSGSSVGYAGGGGGGAHQVPGGPGATGFGATPGNPAPTGSSQSAAANRGGGSGGGGQSSSTTGSGGSGIVIVRY
jgi:hypothetical protein